MIYLSTDAPTARFDGERVIFTVKSGKDLVEIALSSNEALREMNALQNAAEDAFRERSKPLPQAQIIAFTSNRKGR